MGRKGRGLEPSPLSFYKRSTKGFELSDYVVLPAPFWEYSSIVIYFLGIKIQKGVKHVVFPCVGSKVIS